MDKDPQGLTLKISNNTLKIIVPQIVPLVYNKCITSATLVIESVSARGELETPGAAPRCQGFSFQGVDSIKEI